VCNNCGFCAKYGCPIDAKGDRSPPLRNAPHGPVRDRPESYVSEILLDPSGRNARGVRYLDAAAISMSCPPR